MLKKNKVIIIFGASGFFGKSLIDKIKNKNYKIISIKKDKFHNLNKYKKIQLLNKSDFIFHFSNQNNEIKAEQNPIKDIKNNLFLTINILETLKCCSNKPFLIYPSTVSLYEDSKISRSERSKTRIISTYNLHKIINETYINFYNKKYKINSAILRISNVYGHNIDNKRGFLQSLINDYKNNKNVFFYNKGNQLRDYLYIEDLILAFIQIIKKPKKGLFNICSGNSYSFVQLDKIIRNIFVKEYRFKVVSKIKFKKNENTLFKRNFKGSNKKFKKQFQWEIKTNLYLGIKKLLKSLYPNFY
jgi:UDP-glucose 4-epimerase